MKYPALDVCGADPDMVLATVDEFAPTAVDDLPDGVSIFFATADRRDEARAAVARAFPAAALGAREVDDEDWARRSQQSLTPVTVGSITVTPPWFTETSASQPQEVGQIVLTIEPSMGFGTGHHATTRLCLAALQTLGVAGTRVLDVGTGSGVLAITASRLGAADVRGIDVDPDAIANALENLTLNPEARGVRFEVVDLQIASLPTYDIVLANLTGAVLIRHAGLLRSAVAPGGTLIVSGLQAHEQDDVRAAFDGVASVWSGEETGWIGIAFNFPTTPEV